MKAYLGPNPWTASLNLNTTLAPYVLLEEDVGLTVKYCSRLLTLVDAVCASVVLPLLDVWTIDSVGGVMS